MYIDLPVHIAAVHAASPPSHKTIANTNPSPFPQVSRYAFCSMMLGSLVKASVAVVVIRGVGHGGGEGEVGAGVERRVDVDEVDLAGELGEQRRQDVLLVAPDEAVAPGLASAEARNSVCRLQRGFVDRLHVLERQLHPQRQQRACRSRRTCRPRRSSVVRAIVARPFRISAGVRRPIPVGMGEGTRPPRRLQGENKADLLLRSSFPGLRLRN